ncbi:MAG TPA: hypothetical protein VL172_04375 [Kofleriaceae bacterium]|nr:hypothetical protein [Kofleriaceae bacterium]
MTKVPEGFEKPRRKLPDLKWLGIPLLAAVIFAFIMLRVWKAKKENDRLDDTHFVWNQPPPPSLPPLMGVGVPGADQDRVTNIPICVDRRFAGLEIHHPREWLAKSADNPLGRSIAMGAAASSISVLVAIGVNPTEALAGITAHFQATAPTERTIAGELRSGTRGTFTAGDITVTAEAFTFTLGPYTVGVLWEYDPAMAREATADLAAVTRLAVAE